MRSIPLRLRQLVLLALLLHVALFLYFKSDLLLAITTRSRVAQNRTISQQSKNLIFGEENISETLDKKSKNERRTEARYTSLDPRTYGDLSQLLPESFQLPSYALNNMPEEQCVDIFAARYTTYCETTTSLMLNASYATTSPTQPPVSNSFPRSPGSYERAQPLEFCPCFPSTLLGRHNISDTLDDHLNHTSSPAQPVPVYLKMEPQPVPVYLKMEPVLPGGRWSPSDCRSRQRVAIIIPFRDRASHLQKLIQHLHPLLQRQQLDYAIFVVEQNKPEQIFNKGMLMNSAFAEIHGLEGVERSPGSTPSDASTVEDTAGTSSPTTSSTDHTFHSDNYPSLQAERGRDLWGRFDCIVFHDVDMLPEDDRNMYTCSRTPRHVGVYISKYDYKICCGAIFGGATAFTPQQFITVNGYSNEYYGWGGEDDDMAYRMKWKQMSYIAYPRCVSRYTMIKHERDQRNSENPQRRKAVQSRPDVYKAVGLSSLTYSVVSVKSQPLYAHLLIDLPNNILLPDGSVVPRYEKNSHGELYRVAR